MNSAPPAPNGFWVIEAVEFGEPSPVYYFLYGPFTRRHDAEGFSNEGPHPYSNMVLETEEVHGFLASTPMGLPVDGIVGTNAVSAEMGPSYRFPESVTSSSYSDELL